MRIVLDTNAALDWLLFADCRIQRVANDLNTGHLHLLSCPSMREELARMLAHASLAHWQVSAERALATYDRHVDMLAEPQPASSQRLPCRDPDDQVFIDLAITQCATALITRDRALLKLARRARARGVQVLRPQDWALSARRQTSAPAEPPHPPSGR